MKRQKGIVIAILCLLSTFINAQNQDTVRYESILGKVFYETIELYPNNQFKWTSEYDLSWNEFGFYEKKDGKLILRFYAEMDDLKEELNENNLDNPTKTQKYKLSLSENQLFRLTGKGKEIRRKRDKSFRTKWSWLIGHKYTILKKK